MSSYRKLEYCRRCIQMTNHTWHDNDPLPRQYTAECMKCGLQTHESAKIKLTPPNPSPKEEDTTCPDCEDGWWLNEKGGSQCMTCKGTGKVDQPRYVDSAMHPNEWRYDRQERKWERHPEAVDPPSEPDTSLDIDDLQSPEAELLDEAYKLGERKAINGCLVPVFKKLKTLIADREKKSRLEAFKDMRFMLKIDHNTSKPLASIKELIRLELAELEREQDNG